MTIQEYIDELNKIEDKSLEVLPETVEGDLTLTLWNDKEEKQVYATVTVPKKKRAKKAKG